MRVLTLWLFPVIRSTGDLPVRPACGDGAGRRADRGKRQHDLRGLQTSV